MSKISKWWRDFLERLAKAGEEEFHNKPPSCCADLPKRQAPKRNVSVNKQGNR